MLLQIMDEGRLTDSYGRHIDFRNAIIIMTSNIGARQIKNQTALGFRMSSEGISYEKMKEQLLKEVENHFRPEFINRLNDVIVFKSLTKQDIQNVLDIELVHLVDRLKSKELHLELTDAAKNFIVEKGYDADFGARPLKRAMEKLLEEPISEDLLRNKFKDKNHILVQEQEGKLKFISEYKKELAPKKQKQENLQK